VSGLGYRTDVAILPISLPTLHDHEVPVLTGFAGCFPYASSVQDERLLERTIERKDIYTGHYLTFHVDTIADADGGTHTREVVDHPGAVAILALDGGDLLMVRQYRSAIGQVLMEIPAGTLDRLPDGTIEDPAVAAPRELAEETGFAAGSIRLLGRFYTAPGFATELMYLYLATDLSPIPGYAGPEADERIDLQRVPWHSAITMAAQGAFEDAKSILALFWFGRLVDAGEVRP
jgi:ADP-ribose pyrophosphatase